MNINEHNRSSSPQPSTKVPGTFGSNTQWTRRRFLQTSATSAAVLGSAGALGASGAQASLNLPGSSQQAPALVDPPKGTLPFLHGVASGDPIANSVVLWTRITPSPEATPGSGLGEETAVHWKISKDAEFTSVIAEGTERSHPDSDHTIHVDPLNLEPETVYFYRFTVTSGEHEGAMSPVGRTKTAPALGSSPAQLNWAVASCANFESGFFSAYRDMAERGNSGELDLAVFLGDYIYEYAPRYYSGRGPFRLHEPAHDIVSLTDYRIRYGQYRTDHHLQAAHAALPWIVMWDDHEVADNNWREGAENHNPATQGPWIERRDNAIQAYFEWLPVRATSPSEGGHVYRSLKFGNLAELSMLDLRTYRDQEAQSWNPLEFNRADRTMLGSEQFDWLASELSTSEATWNVIGTSVMFSPMNLLTLEQNPQTAEISSALGSNISGIPLNSDQWDGYAAARARLLDLITEKNKTPFFLAGDIHSEWGHSVRHKGREVGVELVCSSISSPNVDETLKLPEGTELMRVAHRALHAGNGHIRHVNLERHGYSVVRIRPEEVQMHWMRVDNITVPESPVRDAIMLRWRKDGGFTS